MLPITPASVAAPAQPVPVDDQLHSTVSMPQGTYFERVAVLERFIRVSKLLLLGVRDAGPRGA